MTTYALHFANAEGSSFLGGFATWAFRISPDASDVNEGYLKAAFEGPKLVSAPNMQYQYPLGYR